MKGIDYWIESRQHHPGLEWRSNLTKKCSGRFHQTEKEEAKLDNDMRCRGLRVSNYQSKTPSRAAKFNRSLLLQARFPAAAAAAAVLVMVFEVWTKMEGVRRLSLYVMCCTCRVSSWVMMRGKLARPQSSTGLYNSPILFWVRSMVGGRGAWGYLLDGVPALHWQLRPLQEAVRRYWRLSPCFANAGHHLLFLPRWSCCFRWLTPLCLFQRGELPGMPHSHAWRWDQVTVKGICLSASPINWASPNLQAKRYCQVERTRRKT